MDRPEAKENKDRPGDASKDSPTVRKQQKIQNEQDSADARKSQSGGGQQEKKALQAGTQTYPETPMPAQHLAKPGIEAEMELKPQFMAKGYRGSGKLDGMSALITGADSGIGRSVAVLFAREGADVAIAYLSETEDAEETRRCVEAEGRKAILIPGDVKDSSFCNQAVQQAVDAFGKLDILVNNAAFQNHVDSIEQLTDERIDETLRTNIFGYIYMARAAVPHIKPGGCIINTGSVVGLQGSSSLLDYSATKGAIHAFTKSLASSLVQKGIRVNAAAPGPVWTPLNPSDSPPEKIEQFGSQTDIGRPAQPEELSPAYVFLASPACASYITGIVLPVTGSVGP
jgi:NAD(P)-dependent dehydrogenase (short-subunit alcohol dehydrogenase family)